jgi:Tol biopolymer transport system component
VRFCRFVALPCVVIASSLASGQLTTRVSVRSDGGEPSFFSELPAISADGRWVAFCSAAVDLAPCSSTCGCLFLHDRFAHTTVRLDVAMSGFATPSLSADGRWIAFATDSAGVVAGDTNGWSDAFVLDRETGAVVRVSVSTSGDQANGPSYLPVTSANGRFVAFTSGASNLASGDTNFVDDVFVRDRDLDGNGVFDEPGGVQTVRASVSSAGAQAASASRAASLSADGRFVAFESDASNLVAGDANWWTDVFVRDLQTGITERASLDSSGADAAVICYWPTLSADGRFVAFVSDWRRPPPSPGGGATPTGSIFVRDRQAGTTTAVDRNAVGALGDGNCFEPSVSADGRFVAFRSLSTNLVPGDSDGISDVFRWDRATGEIVRVSAPFDDIEAHGSDDSRVASGSAMTPDGGTIAFASALSHLVPGDTNGFSDVFVRAYGPTLVSIRPPIGADDGGDDVALSVAGSVGVGGATVTFGGLAAEVRSAGSAGFVVRTPPGAGLVDVVVSTSEGTTGLAAAFSYAGPRELLVRRGNVNLGRDDREDTLLVNAVAGDPITRELTLHVGGPISVVMTSPSSRSSAPFALYVWRAAPDAATVMRLPARVGFVVFPTPLSPVLGPQPFAIANSWDPRLGAATMPSAPAPTIVARAPQGIRRPLVATLQGIIQDDASLSPAHASVTNAIVLRVVP